LKRLRDQVNKSTATKDVIEKFAAIGVEPVVADSDDFIRAVQRDIRNFTRVAKEANIKAD
jgi:tripartite-type tricarboxylate transporter receptor subunit TctC